MAGKITKETVVTLSEVAVVLGLTTRRIRQLVEEGVITTEGNNQYNIGTVVQQYIKFLTAKVPEVEDIKLEKAKRAAEVKLKLAKADRAKLETDELQGKMHRSEDVKAITEDILYSVRNGLTALPGRLAVDVTACTTAAEAHKVIQREVYLLMQEIAGYKYDPTRYEEAVRDRMTWSSDLIDDEED